MELLSLSACTFLRVLAMRASLSLGCGESADVWDINRTMYYSMVVQFEDAGAILPWISRAARAWELAIPGLRIDVSIGDCSYDDRSSCWFVANDTDSKSIVADYGIGVAGFTARGDWGGVGVLLLIDMSRKIFDEGLCGDCDWDHAWPIVALHEMGHVMGLWHAPSGQVMAGYVQDAASVPTGGDVDNFWSHSMPYADALLHKPASPIGSVATRRLTAAPAALDAVKLAEPTP